VFPDKEWMAINTFSGTPHFGRIVATISLFSSSNANGASIIRAYSDNGGINWSPALSIDPMSSNLQGSQPVFSRRKIGGGLLEFRAT